MMQTRAGSRLTLLVSAVAAAGIIVVATAAAIAMVEPRPAWWLLAAFVLATLLIDTTCVEMRVGRHIESYTWAELIIVLGLAFLSPAYLVLTSLALVVAYFVTRRSTVKVIYNAAAYAIGVAIAAIVTHAIASPSWDAPERTAVALIAGVVAFSTWNSLSVVTAIALSQGVSVRSVYGKGVQLRWAFCFVNVMIGFVALFFVHVNPALLLVIPPCLAVAFLGYRAYLHAIQERLIWRHLEATSEEINRLDEREIARTAIARAVALLEADEVELRLGRPGQNGVEQVYVGTTEGLTRVAVTPARRLLDTPANSESSSGTCVDVPLVAHDAWIGLLRVRFTTRVRITDREHRVLRTYAQMITRSIENARLYTEMREHAARSEMAALHDPLTRLPNRVLLESRIGALLETEGDARDFAVLLIDLDHFKDVNDGLGHAAGDQVLCALAERVRRALRPVDTVARVGGDEFAILLADGASAPAAGERLLAVLAQPIEVNGVSFAVGGSIGIACHPEDGSTIDELLQHADIAMYEAKKHRGACRRYRGRRDGTIVDRLSLVAELRTALDDDQLLVHFQPQYDLATRQPVGAEALVRWQHPTRGLLLPSDFVSVVESSSLLREFTCRVLDMAVEECARWQQPDRPLTVAVNLSARDLDDERLPDDVQAVLRKHGLPAEQLVLEITETAILGDLDFVEVQMARLASIGVSLSIDDFGTGHSSLTFLQRVMVHELKIDRSFVAGIVVNENDAAITRATVRLAQSLGLRTVAEGVEESYVLQELVDLRCDNAQGYLWSPPVPAAIVRRELGVSSDALPVSLSLAERAREIREVREILDRA
jgi:diguanylate cyclase (GGDEF)-like protein